MERGTPVPLDFKTVEPGTRVPAWHSLTITGVERSDRGIRITYEIRPPLSSRAHHPHVEARDDYDREYCGLGQHLVSQGLKTARP